MTNTPTARTRAKRFHDRARYDAETVHAILDAQPNCTVAYVIDGTPYAPPTLQWREGDTIYWHGSSASRMLRQSANHQVCVSVMLFDGMVMARSAFRHSMNYRSVVIYGQFVTVDAEKDKKIAMAAFLEHVSPGRNAVARPPNAAELAGTRILRIPLAEAVAKIRNWGVEDNADDLNLPVWAGVIPLTLQAGTAQPEAGSAGYPVPSLPKSLQSERT